jgi:hypothetical protein
MVSLRRPGRGVRDSERQLRGWMNDDGCVFHRRGVRLEHPPVELHGCNRTAPGVLSLRLVVVLDLEVVMRMLLKAAVDTETANEVLRSGEAVDAGVRIMELLQPEAIYAFIEDGQRTLLAVFDLADPSQMPVVTEPLYQLLKAKITLTPCMNFDDAKKGVEEAVRRMASMQG